MSWPVSLGAGALAALGVLTGVLLGKALFKKHFECAGMG
jgi:hypothetical protein